MHNEQVVVSAIIKRSNGEALLTKCKGKFVSYLYKQHLIVIYLYIVENYVAGYRAARQLILQCIYLAIQCYMQS